MKSIPGKIIRKYRIRVNRKKDKGNFRVTQAILSKKILS